MESPKDIERLQARLDRLEAELHAVRVELSALRVEEVSAAEPTPPPLPEPVVAMEEIIEPELVETHPVHAVEPPPLPFVAVEEPVQEPVQSGPDWRDWLRSMNLLPPAGSGNAEVRLGAWWATRIGTLLAVIGVVFFGVYVSINTAPWVKFLELLAVALGVTTAGFWLERKLERFGAVVAAGGLALIYFCAFAAHAVPAVRVLNSPVAAGFWQLAAVGIILGAALWRHSSVMATMAVGLGAATAFFALSGGFTGFALFTVGLLSVVAVAFARLRQWEAPSVLALPAVHAVYLSVWADQWRWGGSPAGGLPWWFLGAVTLVFFLRDWRSRGVSAAVVTHGERWFQGVNSSLAATSGVITALTLYRAEVAWFYFGAAVFFAGMAAVRRRQVDGDLVEVVLIAKATGALTLGVIELTAGRTTALALLVQAAVLAWLAPRLASQVLAWGAGVVAVLAAGFMFKDAAMGGYWLDSLGPLVVFLLGWLWLATLTLRRWLTDETASRIAEVLAGLVAGLLAMVAVGGWLPQEWAPAWLAGLALLMSASAWKRYSPAFLVAGGLALSAAQFWLWQRAWAGQEELRLNAVAVLTPVVALAWVLGGREQWRRVGFGALLVAVFGLAQVFRAELAPQWALAGCLGIGAVMATLAPWTGERRWQAAGTVLSALGVWQVWTGEVALSPAWSVVVLGGLWVLPVVWHESKKHREQVLGVDGWVRPVQLGVAAAATYCLLPPVTSFASEVLIWSALGLLICGLRAWRCLPGALAVGLLAWAVAAWRLEHVAYGVMTWALLCTVAGAWVSAAWLRSQKLAWGRVGSVVVATLMSMQVATVALRGADRLWLMCAVLVVAAALCRWLAMRAARPAALVLAVWALGQAIWLIGGGRASGWNEPAVSVLVLTLITALLPVWITRAGDELTEVMRGSVQWLCGLAGVLVAMLLVWRQPPPLSAYITVGWGLIAVTVFVVGLLARLRSHRLLGLLILAVCVPRVFIVDLNSMLHRIIAFTVLGVVLLWVGFSYHRFRHWIAGETPEKEPALNNE